MEKLMFQKTWRPWILAARPKTLTAAFAPVLVAYFLAKSQGNSTSWILALWALLSSLAIQIATNLINDALDFKKGADTKTRLGPLRVTQNELLTPNQVLLGGGGFFLLAIFFAIPLILKAGWIVALILVLSIISGYVYTGGPYPLAYYGFGDLFVVLFFGLFSTATFYYIQTLQFSVFSLLAGLQVGLLCAVMISINNLRDMQEDAKVQKKTLSVRFGEHFSKIEITLLVFIPYLLSVFWVYSGLYFAAGLPWMTILLANKLVQCIWKTPPGAIYNSFLGFSALIHIAFSLLLCIGLVIDS